jgi:hypothetical protein
MARITHAPRFTGVVVVPLAVTFISAAWVMSPLRRLPGGRGTRRNFVPGDRSPKRARQEVVK